MHAHHGYIYTCNSLPLIVTTFFCIICKSTDTFSTHFHSFVVVFSIPLVLSLSLRHVNSFVSFVVVLKPEDGR